MSKLSSVELELIKDITSYSKNFAGFMVYAFPWGVEGTELAEFKGPEQWQLDIAKEIDDGLISVSEAIKIAVASGHGIGKSAFVSMLILWALSTFEDTKVVVTANTDRQLMTKTWPELAKWHRLCICGHWFKYTATSMYSIEVSHEKTWRADAIPWSANNTEAFAGLHNKGKRIVLIFDEASAIDDKVWEVAEGAMTDKDTEIIWCAFGNPTRNTGRFKDCLGRFKHRWSTRQIDSRHVAITNKAQIKEWEDDYGVDSDFFKIRVRGEFPNQSDRQFIPTSYVTEARGKKHHESVYAFSASIIGVDPAWTGGDEISIFWRKGLMSKHLASYKKNDDDLVIAGYIAQFEDEYKADAVFVDMGYGTGIVSAGKAMKRSWTLVSFASESNDPGMLNKRAQMWNDMKQWLFQGGSIPDDPILEEELIGPEYIVKLNGKIVLEPKADMKKRGLRSPNRADSLALTFAMPIKKKDFALPQVHGVDTGKYANNEFDPMKY